MPMATKSMQPELQPLPRREEKGEQGTRGEGRVDGRGEGRTQRDGGRTRRRWLGQAIAGPACPRAQRRPAAVALA
jgi:hypothetical protein